MGRAFCVRLVCERPLPAPNFKLKILKFALNIADFRLPDMMGMQGESAAGNGTLQGCKENVSALLEEKCRPYGRIKRGEMAFDEL